MTRTARATYGFAISVAGTVVTAGLGLFTTPILLHYLGAERLGAYRAAADLLGYLALLDLGMGVALAGVFAAGVARDDRSLVVDAYSMKSTGDGVEVTVGLRRGARLEQAAIGYSGADLLEAFGIAAAAVLSRFLPDEHRFTLEEMRLLPDPDGAGIVAVTLRLETPRGGERLVGAVSLLEDRYRSAVNAVLDATNRRLGYLAGEGPFVALEPADEPHDLEQERSAALHPQSGHSGGTGG